MHIRTVTKSRPAPASDFVFILDAIAQILQIFQDLQTIIQTIMLK